jgi:hypothetical protein
MIWIFGGTATLVFLWIAAPAVRVLFRSFDSTRRNDATVFQAQHSSSHP